MMLESFFGLFKTNLQWYFIQNWYIKDMCWSCFVYEMLSSSRIDTSAQCWFSTKQIISLQCQSSLDTSSWIPQDTDWSGSPSPCQTISWIQGSSSHIKYQMKGFTWQTMLRRKILPIVAGVCVATVFTNCFHILALVTYHFTSSRGPSLLSLVDGQRRGQWQEL